MKFSWQQLDLPFFCLAPMEGATDAAFRQVVIGCGRPDVCFTEFVNVEGMSSPGKKFVEQALWFEAKEQPLIAQVWGLNPENYLSAAREIVNRGFAGIDINMGCPVKLVTSKGAGGAMIKNQQLASEIIEAVKEGVAGKIPVSVKTRIGFDKIATEEWCGFLLHQNIDALIVHGRTVKEMSKVPVHWDEIEKVVKLRDELKLKTVIIGNGDVGSLEEGREKAQKCGLDGIMIGRAVFHNPWVFSKELGSQVEDRRGVKIKEERILLLMKHLDLYERIYGKTKPFGLAQGKPFEPMKRFFKVYIQDFEGAADLRVRLMATKNFDEAREILKNSN